METTPMTPKKVYLASTALLLLLTALVCHTYFQHDPWSQAFESFPSKTSKLAVDLPDHDATNPSSSPTTLLSEPELEKMLTNIRGDDHRLVRWDATAHTAQKRHEGACQTNSLVQANQVLMSSSANVSNRAKRLAAEYLTFCITDAPVQRHLWSQQQDIHEAVVQLVSTPEDAQLSALAAHLIYITTFANDVNHQTFVRVGAVQALAAVVMNEKAVPVQRMWASAALQNLAASYCHTNMDGRCYWHWTSKSPQLQIIEDSLPLLSDGSTARQMMLAIPGLVQALTELTCQRPLQGNANDNNIFPGENAISPRDNHNLHITTWAAAGALKNIALEPSAQHLLDPVMPCQCQLRYSSDWLESSKSQSFVHHMRRGKDPCWLDKETGDLCVDRNFLDDERYNCYSYQGATREECKASDVLANNGLTANEACCGCGGGSLYSDKPQANQKL